MPTLIDLKDVIIQALSSHLNLGHAEVTKPAYFIWRNFIRSSLDHQPDVAVMGGFINPVSFLECSDFYFLFLQKGGGNGGQGIHCIKAALDEPFLIIAAVR